MEILNFSVDEYKTFILILIRVSIILYMFPVYSSPVIPAPAKTGLALVLTLLLYPVVSVDPNAFPHQTVSFGILIIGEFLVGIALGFTIQVFFGTVQLAGQIIGFQMGFSMINVIDPQSGENISVLSQIGYLAAILLFILLSGHHIIIMALIESFSVVNMGDVYLKSGLLTQLIKMVTGMFVLGTKMAAPAMAALIFTDAAFGICAKFVPQMHILIVAFPVKIVVGLFMFGVTLDILGFMSQNYMSTFKVILASTLVWMGG